MAAEIETWDREHYAAGGGEPFLFYVVYGDVDLAAPLSAATYRSMGVPDGIEVMAYGPDQHRDVPSRYRGDFLWEHFVATEPDCSARVAESDRCIVVRGTPTDATTLNYLRDVVGLLAFMIDHGGVAVYDPQMFRWWSAGAWRESIFQPAAPVPRSHVAILAAPEDDPSRKWVHTRGMRKFGRPDISVRNVTENLEVGVLDLCHRLIEYQAFGYVVPEGQDVRMATLPAGGVVRHAGHLEDPDFNNVHLEVAWPEATR